VVVQEKFDGKPIAFRSKDRRFVIFAEDLLKRHSIPYWVPARYAVFDIYDIRGVFLEDDDMRKVVKDIREGKLPIEGARPWDFFAVPWIEKGFIDIKELPYLILPSYYTQNSEKMEGIVVKPLRELFEIEQLRGKLVRKEFEEGIREHHLRQPTLYNIIDPSKPILLSYKDYTQ